MLESMRLEKEEPGLGLTYSVSPTPAHARNSFSIGSEDNREYCSCQVRNPGVFETPRRSPLRCLSILHLKCLDGIFKRLQLGGNIN